MAHYFASADVSIFAEKENSRVTVSVKTLQLQVAAGGSQKKLINSYHKSRAQFDNCSDNSCSSRISIMAHLFVDL